VFGKQKVANAAPVFRFVFANPEHFCQREVGERGIASELNQPLQAEGLREITALLFRADVAPNQRGANDVALFIEKDRAVHLAGEAHARDRKSTRLNSS